MAHGLVLGRYVSSDSSVYEALVYALLMVPTIGSPVFINRSLPGYLKTLMGHDHVNKLVTRTIFADEAVSLVTNLLCIFLLDKLQIHDVTILGFCIAVLSYGLYLGLLYCKTHLSGPSKEAAMYLSRMVYAVGSSLTLSVAFSSINHIFTPKSTYMGSVIYGVMAIIGAIAGSILIPRNFSVENSYIILMVMQIVPTSILAFSIGSKWIEPTYSSNEMNLMLYPGLKLHTIGQKMRYLIRLDTKCWGLLATVFWSWGARTLSLAPYSYVKLDLTDSNYKVYIKYHGIGQVAAIVYYCLFSGLVRKYFYAGFGLVSAFCAAVSYGAFATNKDDTHAMLSYTRLGLLAGVAQFILVSYQMAFTSFFINNESDNGHSKTNLRPMIAGISSLSGSFATLTMSFVSDFLMAPKDAQRAPDEGETATSEPSKHTSDHQLNKKCFFIIVIPCILGLVFDGIYRYRIALGNKPLFLQLLSLLAFVKDDV